MGLNIKLIIDAKIHSCDAAEQEERETYTENGVFAPKTEWYPNRGEPYKYLRWTCDCGSDCGTINVGYRSVHNGKFKPGDLYEYGNVDGFYFGGYMGWASLVMNDHDCPNGAGMLSDCDGSYSGPFLTEWYQNIKEYVTNTTNPHPKWKQYYDLLSSYKDKLDDCILIHC